MIQGKLITEMATFSKAAYYLAGDEPVAPRVNDSNQSNIESNEYDARAAHMAVNAKWNLLDVSDLNATQLGLLHLNPGEAIVSNMYWNDPLLGSGRFEASLFNYGLRDGVFTNGNAAALVARCDDALVVAFRGTNDARAAPGTLDLETPDKSDWTSKGSHYDLLAPLISALDNYVSDPANGIAKVYVTGHSLGASMAQLYMQELSHGNGYQAITFASPGLSAGFNLPDSRITNFVIDGDAILTVQRPGSTRGDVNFLDLDIAFPNGVDSGSEKHSMTLYREVVSFLEEEGVSLQDLDPPLGLTDFDTLRTAVTVVDRGSSFESTGTRFVFHAGAGGNRLEGSLHDEILVGGLGNDALDGSWGTDIASFAEPKSVYDVVAFGDEIFVARLGGGGDGLDRLSNVEWLNFAGQKVASSAANNSLEYVASHPDLMRAFGANSAAGFSHFVGAGYLEGRAVSFSGLEYIASYLDLIERFGANADAGASHYIQAGRFEGRTTNFDGLAYVASYGDLVTSYGADLNAGVAHYIETGRSEGARSPSTVWNTSHRTRISSTPSTTRSRRTPTLTSGTNHYLQTGYFENRAAHRFDPAQYLANYADLRSVFGTNTQAATIHFITAGYFEGRTA